ncbi:MAG TPA: CAP domain-containing protein [Acidobacteriota bacterium]|nr:CAP domain-containing protein [Acidobacteriota bacterium]
MRVVLLVFCCTILLSNPDRSTDPQRLERAIYEKINAYRVARGLSRLEWSERLAVQARAHSAAMARHKVSFGHSGFRQRVRASGLPYRSAAENVGHNQGFDDPASHAVKGWLESRGHRTNIEGDYDLTGVGVVRSRDGSFYFTQIFLQTPGTSRR